MCCNIYVFKTPAPTICTVVDYILIRSYPTLFTVSQLWHFLLGTGLYGVGAGAIMMPASAEMVRFARYNA